MKGTILVVACLVLACSALPSRNGKPLNPRKTVPYRKVVSVKDDPKIVNGNMTVLGEVPFQISYRSSGRHFCGGIVYNKDWIICAAHCVDGTLDGITGETIVAGVVNLDDVTGQESPVIATIRNAGYNPFTFDNDISLLRLGTPLVFDDNVGPVNLPALMSPGDADPYTQGDFHDTYPNDPDMTGGGSYFVVTGWGTLTVGGSIPNEMYKTNAAYITDDTCNYPPPPAESSGYDGDVLESMVCAGGAGANHDSCQGDSGGPMVLGNLAGVDLTVSSDLVGIVSWGRGCGYDGYPGVYTQVAFHVNWIQDSVQCYEDTGSAVGCN